MTDTTIHVTTSIRLMRGELKRREMPDPHALILGEDIENRMVAELASQEDGQAAGNSNLRLVEFDNLPIHRGPERIFGFGWMI